MTVKDIQNSFGKTIAIWENELNNYSDEDFAKKPDESSWSVGQVYQHLGRATRSMLICVEKCISGNENAHEQKTEPGEKAIAANGFPDVKITLPSTPQNTPQQPENKEAVKNEIFQIKKRFHELAQQIENAAGKGKMKHPVLGFLNAFEWLQSIDIHYRHHLRQKNRLDDFLKSMRSN